MPHRSSDAKIFSKVFLNGFSFCGRLNNDEIFYRHGERLWSVLSLSKEISTKNHFEQTPLFDTLPYVFIPLFYFMANIDHAPSKHMLNLLHILPAFAEKENLRLNALIELNSMTINKYEIITESGQLKLDRVGYSSLSYPFAYGAIPCTWDEDGDPLDIEIVGVTEPLIPGSLVEARIIGIMKFDDGGEVDDKVIAVLADDKRMDHITSVADL